jgi:dienelactone hydrolase
MKRYLSIPLSLLLLCGLALGLAQSASEDFTLTFGDFQSKAELTYPEGESGPFPTVILIAGSGPEDMNAAICAPGSSTPLSSNFKTISSDLSSHGFAVLRYDKRYVTGPCQTDYQKFATLTLQQMLADAETVLKTVEGNPKVDKSQIFLYGWSEGSTVAAALAAKHPELAGVIFQGPVTLSWRDELEDYQVFHVGLPYLKSFTQNGNITAEALQKALAGPGGMVAKSAVNYLADLQALQQGQIKVNSLLDSNSDGALEPSEYSKQALDKIFDILFSPQGPFNMYAPGNALPTVTEQSPKLNMPVLILQGENDANVNPEGAKKLKAALKAAGNGDVTLKLYPGLGHSLGPAKSVTDDNFQPIAPQPLADLATWLKAHSTP